MLKGVWIFILFWVLAAPCAAETVTITFENSENSDAVPDAQATNLYTDLGINFPSWPTIIRNRADQTLRQGISSGGPDPLPRLFVCAPLKVNFEAAMDVREVRLQIMNTPPNFFTVRAYSSDDEVDVFEYRPPERPFFDNPRIPRDVVLRAREAEEGITSITVMPELSARSCFSLAQIDNLSYETARPVVPIEPAPLRPPTISEYRAEEVKPVTKWSGRINDVSVNPANPREVFVTSSTGGLWRSLDGGETWDAVVSLPVFKLNSVHHVTSRPRVIIVTAEMDFQRIPLGGGFFTSGGGVWVSVNGGRSWSLPPNAVPSFNGRSPPLSNAACPARSDAYAISEDEETGRIFISTSCGISFTDNITDGERATWTHNFFTLNNSNYSTRRFKTVSALTGSGVIAAGGDGAWWSNDNGATWSRSNTPTGISLDIHGSTNLPGAEDIGFLVSNINPRTLWFTNDKGGNWVEIPGTPIGRSSCGGNSHVYAGEINAPTPRPNSQTVRVVNILFGNTCDTYRLMTAFVTNASNWDFCAPSAPCSLLTSTWSKLNASHDDTRAIGFSSINLFRESYIAHDGGLDRSTLEGWRSVGSGPRKINALQLYDIKGQQVIDTGTYRLSFGTQDNDLWSSSDETNWPESQNKRHEGGGVTMAPTTSTARTDQWTFVSCGPCNIQKSDPLFQAPEIWAGYASQPSWSFSAPQRLLPNTNLIGPYFHLLDNGPNVRLSITGDSGGGYFDLDTLPVGRASVRGNPKISGSTIYQSLRLLNRSFNQTVQGQPMSPIRDTDLRRYTLGGTIANPAMNNFGSLGHYVTEFQWDPVYAVHPNNSGTLIAPDVQPLSSPSTSTPDIKTSIDGGENWMVIPGLMTQVTRSGVYSFTVPLPTGDTPLSLISAISYFPNNPAFVILGMHMGGAYISQDGGNVWKYVVGSDRIPNITDFEWKSAEEIYVASYGRGLWKINRTSRRIPIAALRSPLGQLNLNNPILRNIRIGTIALAPTLWGLPSDFPGRNNSENLVTLQEAVEANYIDTVFLAVDGKITDIQSSESLEKQLITTPGTTLYRLGEMSTHSSLDLPVDLSSNTRFDLPVSFVKTYGKTFKRATFTKNDTTMPSLFKNIQEDDKAAIRLIEGAIKEHLAGQSRKLRKSDLSIVGIALKKGKLVGPLVGYEPVHQAPSFEPIDTDSNSRPNDTRNSKPYIALQSNTEGVYFGDSVFQADKPMQMEGHNFVPHTTLDIAIDNQKSRTALTNSNGFFEIQISLNKLAPGIHTLYVKQKSGDNSKHTFTNAFLVRHFDKE